MDNNKTKTLIIGAVAGAALGLAGAFLLTRRAEETGTEITVNAGDGLRLGVMIIGLLRAIADLGVDNESKK
jgi:nitrate reductase gamma subunit